MICQRHFCPHKHQTSIFETHESVTHCKVAPFFKLLIICWADGEQCNGPASQATHQKPRRKRCSGLIRLQHEWARSRTGQHSHDYPSQAPFLEQQKIHASTSLSYQRQSRVNFFGVRRKWLGAVQTLLRVLKNRLKKLALTQAYHRGTEIRINALTVLVLF
jgi:hypothetical protein